MPPYFIFFQFRPTSDIMRLLTIRISIDCGSIASSPSDINPTFIRHSSDINRHKNRLFVPNTRAK